MKTIATFALAALLAAAPAAAQQGHHGQHAMPGAGGAMQECVTMMGGPQPEMLLHHRDTLGLTAEQVQRLEAAQAERDGVMAMQRQTMMQDQMAAAEMLQQDSPDFQAYEGKLEEAADQMVQAHVAMAKAAVAARRVLTPEQRTSMQALMASGTGMMGGQGHGMMGGMGGMMMMHCPMMGGGQLAPPSPQR